MPANLSSQDLSGNPIRLSSFRGKPVLLTFWSTARTNTFPFLSSLNEVQRDGGNRFVILGISLDGTRLGVDEEHEHAAHSDGEAHAARIEYSQIRSRVESFVQERKLRYPVLIDPTGDIGYRYAALDLPANIIIDPSGTVCRRFIGLRSPQAIEAMLAAAERDASRKRAR